MPFFFYLIFKLAFSGNGDSCLLADFRSIDLNPVTVFDSGDWILVQFVHGWYLTGYGSIDINIVDLLADETCGSMI